MHHRTNAALFRFIGVSPAPILCRALHAVLRDPHCLINITSKGLVTTRLCVLPTHQILQNGYKSGIKTRCRQPDLSSHIHKRFVASTTITSSLQKEQANTIFDHVESLPPKKASNGCVDRLVKSQVDDMVNDIHKELDAELLSGSELSELAKYYFDGQGKAIRPVIAMTLGHAFNQHFINCTNGEDISTDFLNLQRKQRQVSIISEMIHTASLVHDDILDKADTRRGKVAVNQRWGATRSAAGGDYIIAVGAQLLAQIRNEEVVRVLAQVLQDLVRGEFQQLQTVKDEQERFQLYLKKTFNKTASLIAYSCKANAILSFEHFNASLTLDTPQVSPDDAYQYGRNIGIAFQLIDDLLDFKASSKQLGKPAAADLRLGLATAPVLFASNKFPHLEQMIARRFSEPGDVEAAFKAVLESDGLQMTKDLAIKHCKEAVNAIEGLSETEYKDKLISLADDVINRKK